VFDRAAVFVLRRPKCSSNQNLKRKQERPAASETCGQRQRVRIFPAAREKNNKRVVASEISSSPCFENHFTIHNRTCHKGTTDHYPRPLQSCFIHFLQEGRGPSRHWMLQYTATRGWAIYLLFKFLLLT